MYGQDESYGFWLQSERRILEGFERVRKLEMGFIQAFGVRGVRIKEKCWRQASHGFWKGVEPLTSLGRFSLLDNGGWVVDVWDSPFGFWGVGLRL